MYPLKLEEVYKEKIWGGRNLAKLFNKDLPAGKIGESWELSDHQNGRSKVSNGQLAGQTLSQVMKEYPKEIFGDLEYSFEAGFPLLIKFLDAQNKLSVQVHPDAQWNQGVGELGKTELWYVLAAEPGAELIYGLKEGISKQDFKEVIAKGEIDDALARVEVKTGDAFYIPSGTVHSIGAGIVIAEIQQNSDLTYRLYDWEREDEQGQRRKLHLDQALKAINFDFKAKNNKLTTVMIEAAGYNRRILASSPYFTVENLKIRKDYFSSTKEARFDIFMVLDGSAELKSKTASLKLEKGDTILIPAAVGDYQILGECELLKTYIADRQELRSELEDKGFSEQELEGIIYN